MLARLLSRLVVSCCSLTFLLGASPLAGAMASVTSCRCGYSGRGRRFAGGARRDRLGDATRWRRCVSALACSAVRWVWPSGTLSRGGYARRRPPGAVARGPRDPARGLDAAIRGALGGRRGDLARTSPRSAGWRARRSDRGDRRSRASRRDARDADRPPPRASRSKAPPPFADAAPWTHPDPARAAKYSRLVKRSALGADADAPGLVDASVGGLGLRRRSRDPRS